ncbi:hypothetical protein DPMN_181237 [Dreissena polymorpha]|uniref:Uncharacterized protein n=1 Tax=Dreissena polymorpha TaxID=45954 RepID=A0A9D4DE27_DREPO|nr:hypothetical protein DPMN_181237 [Dreissena polymorpha]
MLQPKFTHQPSDSSIHQTTYITHQPFNPPIDFHPPTHNHPPTSPPYHEKTHQQTYPTTHPPNHQIGP